MYHTAIATCISRFTYVRHDSYPENLGIETLHMMRPRNLLIFFTTGAMRERVSSIWSAHGERNGNYEELSWIYFSLKTYSTFKGEIYCQMTTVCLIDVISQIRVPSASALLIRELAAAP